MDQKYQRRYVVQRLGSSRDSQCGENNPEIEFAKGVADRKLHVADRDLHVAALGRVWSGMQVETTQEANVRGGAYKAVPL
jgi:hypothetical protein